MNYVFDLAIWHNFPELCVQFISNLYVYDLQGKSRKYV